MNFWRASALNLLTVAFFGCILGCGPKDGVREFEAARAAFDTGDYKKADRLFAKSNEYAAGNADTVLYLARTKLALGELAEATEWIEKTEALAPDDVDVRLIGAQIAWHVKDYAKSERLFRGVATDESLSLEFRSEGWAGLGLVRMVTNEPHLARVDFLRAIRLNGRNPSARYHLGLLYRDAPFGYNEAALEQFEFFVRLEVSASPRVQKTQNVIIAGLKEVIARALSDRAGVSSRNSATSATALSKAESAWKKGQFKTARQFYQEALDADVLSYPAALGLAKAVQKLDVSKAGQQKALALYKTSCELRPGAVATALTAGELAVKMGQHAQAAEFYSRAVAANPASLPALDGLIGSLRRVGGQQKAAAAYQSYRELVAKAKKGR